MRYRELTPAEKRALIRDFSDIALEEAGEESLPAGGLNRTILEREALREAERLALLILAAWSSPRCEADPQDIEREAFPGHWTEAEVLDHLEEPCQG